MGHSGETPPSPRTEQLRHSAAVNASNALLDAFDLSRVGLFPLPNVVLFPSQLLSLHVFEPRYRELVSDVIARGLALAVPRLRPGFERDYHGAPPVQEVCGVGQVTEFTRLPDGRFNIVVLGLGRGRILGELQSTPYRLARIEPLTDRPSEPRLVAEASRTALVALARRTLPHFPGAAAELPARMSDAADAGECADLLAGALIEDADERQALLEERDPMRRLTALMAHLHRLAAQLPGSEPSARRSN